MGSWWQSTGCERDLQAGGNETLPDRWIRIWEDMYVEMAGLCLSVT